MPNRLDLSDPAFLKNRYETYRALRKTAPVAATENKGEPTVVLTRYADVDAILRDPRATVQPRAGEYPDFIGDGPAAVFYRLSLPHMDAPEHTRLRRIMTPAFRPQTIAAMEAWVAKVVDRQLDALGDARTIEVVQALAATIPADVACRLLHVPLDDAHLLLSRVPDLTLIVSQSDLTPEGLAKADAAAQFYFDYFGALTDRCGALPDDDFLGALIKTEQEGLMSREELAVTLIGVFLASYHTTMVSLTNAVSALALYPRQRALLAVDPGLALRAWEEVLRFDGPVHFIHRYASEAIELGEHRIGAGVRILLGLAAANRDEAVFHAPDVFDIARPPIRHLAFAGGAHFCLGSQLSRLEGRLFLNAFVARFPQIRLAGLPEPRSDDLTFPHAQRLTVELGREP